VRGLSAGDRVVVSGTFLVDSESRMKAAAAGVYGVPERDPVCGMDVDEAKARAAGKTVDHQGKTFYFCSDQCKSRFEKSPERFATRASTAEHDHDHEHTAQR
jgi:YHS domain-containing protein